MTCDDAELLLAANAVGDLSAADAEHLRRHLEGCAHCRIEGRRYQHTATMIAETVAPMAPPSRLRETLMAQVRAEAADHTRGPSATARSAWYRRLWQAIPAGRPFSLAAAACAALATAVAAWSFTVPRGNPAIALRIPACGAAGTTNVSCRLVYEPAAHQSVVTVTGLAAPPVVGGAPLQTYELWLISAGGRPTPAALLTQRPGTAEWSAAIPVDIAGYAALAATAESSPRGVLTPQGPEVLRIALPQWGSSPQTGTPAPGL